MAAAEWLATYAGDVDNVRAALDWSFGPAGDVATGLAIVGASHTLWAELGLIFEHRHWVEDAPRRCTTATPPEATARLLSWQAGDVREMDDPTEYDDAMRAAAIYRKLGDRFNEGRMLLRAGTARILPDAVAQGERLLHEAQQALTPSGQTKSLARCLGALATARLYAGDPAGAHELHARSAAIYREIGDL